MQTFPAGAPLTVLWHFTKPDGSPFSISGFTYKLFYRIGIGTTEVSSSMLSASGDVLTIVFPQDSFKKAGYYSFKLELFQNGSKFRVVNYNDAFCISPSIAPTDIEETQKSDEANIIHLYTASEWYLFSPIVPVVDGVKGYWVVNGIPVVDGSGNYVYADHSLTYNEEDNTLIIDKGRVDAEGHDISVVITSLADALSQAKTATEIAESVASHMPKIINGTWHVWSKSQNDYVNTGINATGPAGSDASVTTENIIAALGYSPADETELDDIVAKIPSQATPQNQLADKDFVNSSIATNTATFRGTVSDVSSLPQTGIDENDYAFVVGIDSAGNTIYSRYKYTNGQWVFEFTLNNSSFTAAQWAAIQSGITSGDVSKLAELPDAAGLAALIADTVALKADKDTDAEEGNIAKFDKDGNPVDSNINSEDVALKDGYYKEMTVGLAENLIDTKGTGADTSFTKRTSAGTQSLADDGAAIVQKFYGTNHRFNQYFYHNNNFIVRDGSPDVTFNNGILTVTLSAIGDRLTVGGTENNSVIFPYWVTGHKYLLSFLSKAEQLMPGVRAQATFHGMGRLNVWLDGITDKWQRFGEIYQTTSETAPSTEDIVIWFSYVYNDGSVVGKSFSVKDIQFFDLTEIFGEGNEPSTVEEFYSWLRDNVGRHPTYGHTDGILLPNKTRGIKTIGFNRYNPETGTADLIYYASNGEHQYQITGDYTALSFIDVFGNEYLITPDSNGYFEISADGTLTVTGGDSANTCVHLCWNGYRDGEWEEYWEQERIRDLTVITGKKDGIGESVVIFPDGLKRAGSVYDEIDGKKAIKRVGSVNLGSLEWWKNPTGDYRGFYLPDDAKIFSHYTTPNVICAPYPTVPGASIALHYEDAPIRSLGIWNQWVGIKDETIPLDTTAAAFKERIDGVILYYELETPEVYVIDEGFNTSYKVADFGTEEIIPSGLDTNNLPRTSFAARIKYNNDFTREVANLPDNYAKKSELLAKQDTISDLSNIRDGAAKGSTSVQPSEITGFITRSVSDLANYYLKSETYTKSEVLALIAAIQQFHYEIYASLSDVTSPAANVLYLIGPIGTGSDRYEEYVYASGSFVKIGDTSIALSGYVTTQALNAALADYTTTQALSQLLSEKENISNKTTSLSSASTDLQYPSAKAVYDIIGDVESLINAL